jgi:two-component system OmpR family sensor kinase
MFDRARRRLTLLYVALFGVALVVFSGVFFVVLTIALNPNFDLTADNAGERTAVAAYRLTVEQLAVALVTADVIAVLIVGVLAWRLAARTLRPIREAHDRQRRFVADASHEMRSPVAAIRTLAEVAAAHELDVAETHATLTEITAATERLSRLASDLLLLARSDDADVETRGEVFDLSVVVAEAYQMRARATPSLSSRATLLLGTDLPVSGDPNAVARIADNLIDNALRYGGPDVRVRVSTIDRDHDVVLEVADTGPGIAEADLERIFQPFYRVRSDTAAPEGTGLGLAIAAGLARRNRGRLSVRSRPGSGTTFSLVLPRFR